MGAEAKGNSQTKRTTAAGTETHQGLCFIRTCVVLRFQVQVVQLVNVADVHLLFVQLRFVEVLTGIGRKMEKKTREKRTRRVLTEITGGNGDGNAK